MKITDKIKEKKVLVLGSGAIRIGQAGEFDYSGTQAIKALKELNINTILINPNIATVQTSENLADRVYFLPLLAEFVTRVVAREKPDGVLLGFGGQTALNLGLELEKQGFWKENGVRILGTPLDVILDTEDRSRFSSRLSELGMHFPRSRAVKDMKQAREFAREMGFPLMCRAGFSLGGLGSGVVRSSAELDELGAKAFAHSDQLLMEEYLEGWKEIEYEIVRDEANNCIVVCSMENLDPMGIHTGESIVVAPAQTLTSKENFKLRRIAMELARDLGIIGECNVQFALNPESGDYRIIEMNARLSRSSALASKATGYPLAFIACQISLGLGLVDLPNRLTGNTSACCEPAMDYVAVKFPRWDTQKFSRADRSINTEMKSVGEVMALARSFEEAIQKAIRMLDMGMPGIVGGEFDAPDLDEALEKPTDQRIFAVARAFEQGYSVEAVHRLSRIDSWFLHRIRRVVKLSGSLSEHTLQSMPMELLRTAKRAGFSDVQLSGMLACSQADVRARRISAGIVPVVKRVDTMAGEYPVETNYLYLTYNGDTDDPEFSGPDKVVVLGSGAYRIGASVEFDWCCVHAVQELKELGYSGIMINSNPETVSTDFDVCDRLYFEEETLERVLDIVEKESPRGVIVSMGGQVANGLALPLANAGVRVLGTSPDSIDRAENRRRFSQLLDDLGVDQPEWRELTTAEDALSFCEEVGYPVLVRPSYVLSGAAMGVVESPDELTDYLERASAVNTEFPVVITKFISPAREIEIDAVACDGRLAAYAVSEHLENAGVHSGDATLVLPPQRTYLETMRRIKKIAGKIALALKINGPFNIQFVARNNDVKVIECNLRASRSFPFVSKVLKENYIRLATRVIMGKKWSGSGISSFDVDHVGVKAAQFSFCRLKDSDPQLGVEMASTGEVACLGDDFYEAFLKCMLSVGYRESVKNVMAVAGNVRQQAGLIDSLRKLTDENIRVHAPADFALFLRKRGVIVEEIQWETGGEMEALDDFLDQGALDLVIYITGSSRVGARRDREYHLRRRVVDRNIPLITNMKLAHHFCEAITRLSIEDLKVKAWQEY